jgi:hypothetical protein
LATAMLAAVIVTALFLRKVMLISNNSIAKELLLYKLIMRMSTQITGKNVK